MQRGILATWHAVTLAVAACLYFFFVLPRWPELAGHTSPTLGTVLRIVTGALVLLAAVPVALDLKKRRPPEFGTPQLALALRRWSIAGHLLAGLLIIGAAVAEIWVSLDHAGQVLFGIYAAAAAVALLGAAAFYLAFAAETTPAPPKPPRPIKPRAGDTTAQTDTEQTTEITEPTVADADADAEATEGSETAEAMEADKLPFKEPAGWSGLRNRRSRKQPSDVSVSD